MAVYSFYIISALLMLSSVVVDAENQDNIEDVTVETVEDDVPYTSPKVDPMKVHFVENFDDEAAFKKKWIKSKAKKQDVDEVLARYNGKWEIQAPIRKIFKNDLGLVLTTEAKHAAIAAPLRKTFEFKDKPLIVQYEVTLQEGQTCGGAYIKLLSEEPNSPRKLEEFFDKTPYTIMFGPDKCYKDNKLHFIFKHKNPINGSVEEKHCKKPNQRLEEIYGDKNPHLYTLIVRPDNTFTILVDNKEVNSGSLLEDFTPPVNPPEEIDDPNDKKPEDWDEREKIVDPTAKKPEDWDDDAPAEIDDPNAVKPDGWLDDEPETIPDAEAEKPEDWDSEIDGEWKPPHKDNPKCSVGCGVWTPPKIPNPEYKGVWQAPLIDNPNYKGKWTPRRIRNPNYFKDDHPFKMTPINAVGFELWSMSSMLLFDNLIVTDDLSVVEQWTKDTFTLKQEKISKDSDSVLERVMSYAAQNPWVYIVVIVLTFVLVGLFVYICCGSKSDPEEDVKKTDFYQEDDVPSAEYETEEKSTETDKVPEKPTKADLEGPIESDKLVELEEPDSTEENVKNPQAETEGSGDGPRKRKPRKE